MSRTPAPNQLRWMAGRSAALAVVAGVAVAFQFGGVQQLGRLALSTALLIGSLAAATFFAVAMILFVITMPRIDPRFAVWISLVLGAVAAFAVGAFLQPIFRLA